MRGFAYDPALLMMGKPLEILWAFLSATLGALLLGASTIGYLTTRLSIPSRIPLFAAAVLLLVPGWLTDLCGIVVGALVLLVLSLRKRGKA